MIYEQRAALAPEGFEPLAAWWRPELERDDGGTLALAPAPGDAYVVIDDLGEGLAVAAVAPWPHLDRSGRLAFGSERSVDAYRAADLQAAVTAARRAARQVAPDRALRVGDAFWVRGLRPPTPTAAAPFPPPAWEACLDVTRAARQAARVAQYGALAPRLAEAEARAAGLLPAETAPDEPPPPPRRGPIVRPAL